MGAPGSEGLRALYFAYFAFIGVFSPYLSLYFAARGLGIVEIAVLMSLPQALRIVAPPFWGWMADRSARRVALLRASAVASLGLALLFPGATGLAPIAVLMLLLFFFTAAHGPISETLALAAAEGDQGRYGRIRVWGSVGFVATVLGAGPLLDRWGVTVLPWLMAVPLALLAIVTFRLSEPPVEPAPRAGARVRQRLREPAVLVFLLASFLMVFAHAALYSFYSLLLERAGYSKTAIGLMWGIGVVAEIALFALQRPLFDRIGVVRLLGASFAVCALRFAMIGWSGGSAWLLVQAQLMHAVTFGLHHSASMALVHRWFPPAQQARAQAAYVVAAYGLGGSAGGLAAGWIWETVSPEAAFLGAAVAALLGWAAVGAIARLGAGDAGPRLR